MNLRKINSQLSMLSEELMMVENDTLGQDFKDRKKIKLGTKQEFVKGKYRDGEDVYGTFHGKSMFRIVGKKNGKWGLDEKYASSPWKDMTGGLKFSTSKEAAKYLSDALAKRKSRQKGSR